MPNTTTQPVRSRYVIVIESYRPPIQVVYIYISDIETYRYASQVLRRYMMGFKSLKTRLTDGYRTILSARNIFKCSFIMTYYLITGF